MGRARDWLRALAAGLDLPAPPGGGSWSRFARSADADGGSDEREAMHEGESATISAVADMLEARFRAREMTTDLESAGEHRSRDGFRDGPDVNLAYDYAAFGMHTLKTLLELNVRAHRKLTQTLRAAAEASGAGEEHRDAALQPTQVVELTLGKQALEGGLHKERLLPLGEFEIVNQRGQRLGLEFEQPCELDWTPRPITLKLVFLPACVDLAAGESRKVRVYLDLRNDTLRVKSGSDQSLTGTIRSKRLHGDRAPIRVRLTIESELLEGTELVAVDAHGNSRLIELSTEMEQPLELRRLTR